MQERTEGSRSWTRAVVAASAIIVSAYLGLALVPDRLVAFLTTRVSPDVRDLLVTGYFIVAVLTLSWFFVVAQHRWER